MQRGSRWKYKKGKGVLQEKKGKETIKQKKIYKGKGVFRSTNGKGTKGKREHRKI